MTVIYKPERELLYQQIKKFSSHIRGDILGVGSGEADRYSNLFNKKDILQPITIPDLD